jgi:hypothetical protein
MAIDLKLQTIEGYNMETHCNSLPFKKAGIKLDVVVNNVMRVISSTPDYNMIWLTQSMPETRIIKINCTSSQADES